MDGEQIRCIHVDWGSECDNWTISSWCLENNIKLETKVGYHPEANRIAERCNRTLLEIAKTLRFDAHLPEEFWQFSVETATYLHNRGPVSKNSHMTSLEACYGAIPEISKYKVWGYPAYAHTPK